MLKNLLYSFIIAVLFFSCEEKEAESTNESGNASFTVSYAIEGENIEAGEEDFLIIQPGDIEVQLNKSGKVSLSNLEPGNYTVSDIVLVDYLEPTPFIIETNTTTEVSYNVDLSIEQVIEILGLTSELPKLIELIKIQRTGTYSKLKNIFDSKNYTYYYSEFGSDILYTNRNGLDPLFDNYLIKGSESPISNLWINCYSLINNANKTIELIEGLDLFATENEIAILAEMKFLRALTYFTLVKTYNRPVLIDKAASNIDEISSITNSNPSKIYDLIIDDLKFAQINLINESNTHFASIQAANTLLGKVYLQMTGAPLNDRSKYTNALEELKKVENQYQLEANYSDIFALANENTNSEVIFSIAFDTESKSTEGLGNYGTNESWFGPLGDGSRLLEEDFIAAYFEDVSKLENPISFPIEVADTRFYQNIITYSSNETNLSNIEDWTPNKFTQLESVISSGESGVDFPYLRYADVLLMIAEVENAINGPTQNAYDAFNLVRRRAFGDSNHDLASNLNQEEFLDTLLEERRLELCFEGHRKDDLVRTGKLAERIEYINTNYNSNRDFSDYESIWPIPQQEIDISGGQLTQNPGY